MGLPSYAHPIIGECWSEGTSNPSTLLRSLSPYKDWPSWLVAKTDSLRTLGAYKWEYCKPYPALNSWGIYPSSPVKLS